MTLNAHVELESEVNAVKQTMDRRGINLDVYSKVWDECYSQEKDRIESAAQNLELNRNLMALEAKRAAKLEKKHKILLGGH
ncbi:unnamed protein product [Adineta steineri]|uniref:Uncharacterized protein n=1 Tax=Adineta steineri TaxID=433720 RepID=A0A820AWP1_9BILA|nr:unnamed protein product [Adineta steineri]